MSKYKVVLLEGAAFTPPWGGRKFRRGLPTPVSDNRIDYFRNSGRFKIIDAAEHDASKKEPAKRTRSRAETRGRRSPLPPVENSGVSEERLRALATADVSTKLKRGALVRLADEIGATGPDGEVPKDAPNKPDLVDWISRRQGEVLAELAAKDVVESEPEEEVTEEEDPEDLEDPEDEDE